MAWAVPGRALLPGQTQHLPVFMDRAAGMGLCLGNPVVPQMSGTSAPKCSLTSAWCPQTPPAHEAGEIRAPPAPSREPSAGHPQLQALIAPDSPERCSAGNPPAPSIRPGRGGWQ